MTPVTDKQGNTVAYLYNNIVLDISTQTVMGVILGNCIFGDAPTPLGKFFNNVFRNTQGKVVAMANNAEKPGSAIDKVHILDGAWKILKKIKEHVCGWIPEGNEWSETSLTDFLKAA